VPLSAHRPRVAQGGVNKPLTRERGQPGCIGDDSRGGAPESSRLRLELKRLRMLSALARERSTSRRKLVGKGILTL
jgi:hypothetical protein